jgi:pyridoxine 5-phosphate synthase
MFVQNHPNYPSPPAGPTAVSVNVNKVALLRNARHLQIPSVTRAAEQVLQAGAHGITVHPRPDERHIRPSDVRELAALMKDWPNCEFNIEGNPTQNLMPYIEAYAPHQCTFVPDQEGQLTSDHGWRLDREDDRLGPLIERAKRCGSRVSLFVDADPAMMPVAAGLGADRVELYTEPYARAFESGVFDNVLAQYRQSAQAAQSAGLTVNAGHDLNLANLPIFLVGCGCISEVSIGHAFVADALERGYSNAVRAYLVAANSTASGLMGKPSQA